MGLTDLEILDRTSFGIDDCAQVPLFTAELVALMRRLVPLEQQDCVATSVIVRARKPWGNAEEPVSDA